MLRRIRLRLRPPSLILSRNGPLSTTTRFSSAVAYKVREEDRDLLPEPYGLEYGSGPSRIPYQPPHRHQPHRSSPRHAAPSPVATYVRARTLRKRLQALPHGVYAHSSVFWRRVLEIDSADLELQHLLQALSRLELHTILHHLVRERKGNLAAATVLDMITMTPRMRRRRLFSEHSISALLASRKNFNFESSRSIALRQPPPNPQPTLEEQISPPASTTLNTLINILEALQDVRFRRTPQMYWVVMKQCLQEFQPDLAAKIYVGLVEEWVTEGRVAEGANPEDFYPGGGPPREEVLQRKQISDMVKRWWTGVRTWRLPGEVLSPHDRLDLWHPRHLSLGEKMRNFPFPLATSPPSTVPQPDSNMLALILDSLTLDPGKASPAQVASSMRALALLANTVLSRTLPISALGGLLQVFNAVPYKPDVFPDNISTPPDDNAWAYTAFTQIHVTLMSLLFSPPISAESIRMLEAHQRQRELIEPPINMEIDEDGDGSNSPEPKSWTSNPQPISPYMLPPLSFASCRIILYYALKGLKRPAILKTLIKYKKETFGMGGNNPVAYNIILELGSFLRDNALARQAEVILFGQPQLQTSTASELPTSSTLHDNRTFFSSHRIQCAIPQSTIHDLDISPLVGAGPIPDEKSLIHLLAHLTATSQFDRFIQYVYRLMPFLQLSSTMPPEEMDAKREELGVAGDEKIVPDSAVTPDVYAVILAGLEKAGKTGLAQRVFRTALRAEAQAINGCIPTEGSGDGAQRIDVPTHLKLPIGVFTTMLRVWENEYQAAKRASSRERYRERMGWTIPQKYCHLPCDMQAAQMAMITHELVRQRYKHHAGRGAVDEEYYEALIRACAGRWGLDRERKTMARTAKQEMRDMIYSMRRSGIPVPELIKMRLEGDISVPLTPGYKLWPQLKSREEQAAEKEAKDAPAALLEKLMGH